MKDSLFNKFYEDMKDNRLRNKITLILVLILFNLASYCQSSCVTGLQKTSAVFSAGGEGIFIPVNTNPSGCTSYTVTAPIWITSSMCSSGVLLIASRNYAAARNGVVVIDGRYSVSVSQQNGCAIPEINFSREINTAVLGSSDAFVLSLNGSEQSFSWTATNCAINGGATSAGCSFLFNTVGTAQVSVQVTNTCGFSNVATRTVTVNPVTQPKPVAPQPITATLCATQAITLTATPGAGGQTIRWYDAPSGGGRLATGLSYTTPILSSSTKYYICSYNQTSDLESDRQLVQINYENISNYQGYFLLQDQTVEDNTDAIFNYFIGADEKLSYQWQKSTDNGQTFTTVTNEKKGELKVLADIATNNNTKYKCVITNSFCPQGPLASNPATLKIKYIRDLDKNLPVGKVAGSAGVSGSGAANYSIPIFTPPGTAGVQPNIAVAYNSQAGDGLLGLGWNLSGLSSISRVGNNLYYDGKVQAVNLSFDDKFAMDGQRLILTGGTYGGANATYHTAYESFAIITSSGTLGNGPEKFVVVTKDKTTIEYGSDANSRFTAASNPTAMVWYISKITDNLGNYIKFTYIEDNANGRHLPLKIEYTGTASQVPYNSINFIYETRQDIQTSYTAGIVFKDADILKKIQVKNENNLVKEYQFTYLYENGQTKLSEIKEAGGDGLAYNSTLVRWGAFNYCTNTSSALGRISESTMPIDFNGNGTKDFIMPDRYGGNPGKWTIIRKPYMGSTSYEQVFTPIPVEYFATSQLKINDFDGDGLDDILSIANGPSGNGANLYLYNKTGNYSLNSSISYNSAPTSNIQTLIGDFDGDNITDVLLVNKVDLTWKVYSTANTNPKSLAMTNSGSNFPSPGTGVLVTEKNRLLFDCNGDGKTEIMIIGDANSKIYSLGTSVITQIATTPYINKNSDFYFGDFNGDGKIDVLNKNKISETNITWNIEFGNGVNFTHNDYGQFTEDKNFITGDFNGDGKTDVGIFSKNTSWDYFSLDIYYSKGLSFETHNTFSANQGISGELMVEDFDGDGVTDLYFSHLLKLVSNGRNSLLVQSVIDGMNYKTEFKYKPLNDATVYTKGSGAVYPVQDISPGTYVVSAVNSPNGFLGTTNVFTTTYNYEGLKYHARGLGMLGFSKVSSTDVASGMSNTSNYAYDNLYYHTYLKSSQAKSSSGALISSSVTSLLAFSSPGAQRYFIASTSGSSTDHLTSITSSSSANYEAGTGNLVSTTTSNELYTTTTNYSNYNAFGSPGHVESITARGSESFTKAANFEYYTNGLLWKRTDDPGKEKAVTTTFTYNNKNIESTKVSATGCDDITTSQTYDPKGRVALTQTNALGHVAQITVFDYGLGLVKEAKDPNGLVSCQLSIDG